MFRKLPSFHALAAFEAVARHQSFARAARELCVTESAVSHRIRTLEQHFSARFFVRTRRAVTLTAQGTCLLGAVLEALCTLQDACTRLERNTRKTVRLSVGPAFARNWLLERLGSFYRLHRDVDLEINAVKLAQRDKLACLKSGEADMAIRYGEESDWPGSGCFELIRSEVFPVCSLSYRAALGEAPQPRALLDATLLRLPRQPWKPWFRAAGLACEEPDHGPLFSDAGLMLEAAAKGQGVALARSALADEYLDSGRLARLFDVSIPSDCAYYAVCLPEVAARPEVASFIEWLVTSVGAPRRPARRPRLAPA